MSCARRPTARSVLYSRDLLYLEHCVQASIFHRHWVTVPVPHQQGRQRVALLQRPMDVAAAVAAVRALVPPALSNLTCSRGAPGRPCQDQAVPTRLEPLQGSTQCTVHTSAGLTTAQCWDTGSSIF